MSAITKWSQDQCTGDNVSKRERKDTKVLTTSLTNKNTPLNKNVLC